MGRYYYYNLAVLAVLAVFELMALVPGLSSVMNFKSELVILFLRCLEGVPVNGS